MPAVLSWMLKNQGQEDREGFLREMMQGMPVPAFQGIKGLAQQTVSAKDWEDLTKRIPELQG